MSYILDALRRADSERERGSIPTLHANARARALGDDEDSSDGRSKLLASAVALLSLALALALAWLFFGGAETRAPQILASAPQMPPPTYVASAPPVEAPYANAVVPVLRPEPVRAASSVRLEVAEASARDNSQSVEPSPKAPVFSKPSKPVARALSEEKPAPKVADLPEDIRRQLPQLSVSGASYSENSSRRMLILNGQVFREGDRVSEGLELVQIQLKSAVLDYRGTRYSISF